MPEDTLEIEEESIEVRSLVFVDRRSERLGTLFQLNRP